MNNTTIINAQLNSEHNADVPVITSDQLLGSKNIVLIQHQSCVYQLRQTKAGKLILTKYLS